MSKSNAFENAQLLLWFNNTNVAGLGDATGVRGSTVAGSLYVGLHTADPGEAGTQATNETAYAGYTRVAVVRSAAGWTVAGNVATNAAVISFPACTAGSATITHVSVGVAASGATMLLWSGALNASLPVVVGTVPDFQAGELDITED